VEEKKSFDRKTRDRFLITRIITSTIDCINNPAANYRKLWINMPSSVVANVHEGPIVKRQKLNALDAPKKSATESRIFTPFRVCPPFYPIM
jgi:hypothetical protein